MSTAQLLKNELYTILANMGARSDLLSIIGNWSDNATDEETLVALRAWRRRN